MEPCCSPRVGGGDGGGTGNEVERRGVRGSGRGWAQDKCLQKEMSPPRREFLISRLLAAVDLYSMYFSPSTVTNPNGQTFLTLNLV
jgi:hypothetical protein